MLRRRAHGYDRALFGLQAVDDREELDRFRARPQHNEEVSHPYPRSRVEFECALRCPSMT